jgi:hypothetical protein
MIPGQIYRYIEAFNERHGYDFLLLKIRSHTENGVNVLVLRTGEDQVERDSFWTKNIPKKIS